METSPTPAAVAARTTLPTPPVEPRFFVRNLALGGLLELFLISAVVSLLLIRGGLALTGFPKVGGGGLHIAHMIWGGLLMLISLVLLYSFLGRPILYLAALISGIGFGTFVDELGKFLTSDNNYFFRPTVVILYIVFILLFVAMRELDSHRRFSQREMLANAFDMAREATLYHRRPNHTGEVLAYLNANAGSDPLLNELRTVLLAAETQAPLAPKLIRRIQLQANRFYLRVSGSPRLQRVVLGVFILYTLFTGFASLLLVVALMADGLVGGGSIHLALGKIEIADEAVVVSNVITAVLVGLGAGRLRSSRLHAYGLFQKAVLVQLLVAQVFAFYTTQFEALTGVAVDLALLLMLSGMIRFERRLTNRLTPVLPLA
ncbi:MAG: hypothetical protein M3024_02915 [Candidatus Dormibacteraeota bacterium]|nr:hypothetical protein [Candidatus Dormibacteraeota bacterium]